MSLLGGAYSKLCVELAVLGVNQKEATSIIELSNSAALNVGCFLINFMIFFKSILTAIERMIGPIITKGSKAIMNSRGSFTKARMAQNTNIAATR